MVGLKACWSRRDLQHYLEGWTSQSESSVIEEHLQECSECEQTLAGLESEQGTDLLLDSLRDGVSDDAAPSPPHEKTNSGETFPDPLHETSEVCESVVRQSLEDIERWPWDAEPSAEPQGHLPMMIDHYEVLELIGQGGMAQVYRARHHRLQRTVAVKLLNVPRWQATHSLSRLEREIAVVGQLHHPAIVAATDTGQYQGVPYLVTEFIDGLNLSQLSRGAERPEVANACEAIRVAALGLAHAHAQGITHRDIKPSNLMIDRQGQVKILDFGLVHLEGWQDDALELTTVGQLLGTLDYMAPEQADKATAVDHRSDIYALGATLFRLLCGRAPYAASLYQSPLEKLRLLAMTEPPRVETLRPDLPEDLAALINRCLARDPSVRPPSAAHLAEALEPFCSKANLSEWVQKTQTDPVADRSRTPVALAGPLAGVPFYGNVPSKQLEDRHSDSKRQAAAGLARVDGTNGGGAGRFLRWIGLAAGGAAAIWLGILIVIQTQQGVVVIESESANIQVSLRQDGQESEKLELKPGLNQTRVWAGTYEILIDGQADGFELDQQTLVVKRGEAVLAKVSQKPSSQIDTSFQDNGAEQMSGTDLGEPNLAASGEQTASQVPEAIPTEPVYQGKNYQQWASIFQYERDIAARYEALDALARFRQPYQLENSRDLFTEVLIGEIPGEAERIHGLASQSWKLNGLNQRHWDQLQQVVDGLEPDSQPLVLRDLSKLVHVNSTDKNYSGISTDQYFKYMGLFQVIVERYVDSWPKEENYIISNVRYLLIHSQRQESEEKWLAIVQRAKENLALLKLDHDQWFAVFEDFPSQYVNSMVPIYVDVFSKAVFSRGTSGNIAIDDATFCHLIILQSMAQSALVSDATRVAMKLESYLDESTIRGSVRIGLGKWQMQLEKKFVNAGFFRLYDQMLRQGIGESRAKEMATKMQGQSQPRVQLTMLPIDDSVLQFLQINKNELDKNFAQLLIGTWYVYAKQAGLPTNETLKRIKAMFAADDKQFWSALNAAGVTLDNRSVELRADGVFASLGQNSGVQRISGISVDQVRGMLTYHFVSHDLLGEQNRIPPLAEPPPSEPPGDSQGPVQEPGIR